mgnify:CR=1 FL=1
MDKIDIKRKIDKVIFFSLSKDSAIIKREIQNKIIANLCISFLSVKNKLLSPVFIFFPRRLFFFV